MRLAIVKILQQQLQDFLTIAGIEMQGMKYLKYIIYDNGINILSM